MSGLSLTEPVVIVESHVPYVGEIAGARVLRLPPEAITADAVREADALIIRTRTRCDAALLEGSRCRVIATATIGTDHIDLDYCRRHDIAVYNAPGCNAPAVASYVLSAVVRLARQPLEELTIAIVGVGHVGTIVERWARSLGMRVMCVDPERCRRGDAGQWYTLDQAVAAADIITLHTPLTTAGPDATWHMVDGALLDRCRRRPLLINAARGPVIDTPAVVAARKKGLLSGLVIDCWEGEPHVDAELVSLADIATPHIAGYSLSGKIRATSSALEAVCRSLGLPVAMSVDSRGCPVRACGVAETVTPSSLLEAYDPDLDVARFDRHAPGRESSASPGLSATEFERRRDTYALRPEPSA